MTRLANDIKKEDALTKHLPEWLVPALPFILIGTILRLYALGRQIIIDDEWHSLNFVIDKSFFTIFTTHGLGANCIPQNIYNWLLFHTVGWSEMLLRMPSYLCGILSLVIFPPLVEKITDRRTSLIFGWLLALSPCVIFYSRLSRPFSMVMFFGFLALLALFIFLRTNNNRYLYLYAFSGFIAIYFHLYAAISILTPLLCLLILVLVSSLFKIDFKTFRLPSTNIIILPGAIMALLGVLLLAPAHLANPWWLDVLGNDHASFQSLLNFLLILAGTTNSPISWMFTLLTLSGLYCLLKSDRLTGILLTSILAAFGFYLLLSTQEGMHAALQIARYGILLFPVAFLLVSVAFDHLMKKASLLFVHYKNWSLIVPVLFLTSLALTSPLWEIYKMPNNFTNLSAFQDSYKPFDWSKSRLYDFIPQPPMNKTSIPDYYLNHTALNGIDGIIEYPMFIGGRPNLYYFYQHFHKKEMAAGYLSSLQFSSLSSKNDFVNDITPIDYILCRAASQNYRKLKFKTLVALNDMQALTHRYRNWIVIVHKDVVQEMLGINLGNPNGIYQPSATAVKFLMQSLGKPIFTNNQIVVWRIQ